MTVRCTLGYGAPLSVPVTKWGWEITPQELACWTVAECESWMAFNKPAGVVCHPSKQGPWSSLAGACRQYWGLQRVHMPFRLDRETSGVVVVAKDAATASQMQRSVQQRRVRKTYIAILCGEMRAAVTVEAALGRHPSSQVTVRQAVVEGGQAAVTRFEPLAARRGYTLARVHPETGRLHQIRVHAAHIGHPLAGDKIYGPDERLFLEFLAHGFSGRIAAALPLERQALHCLEAEFQPSAWFPEGLHFFAPLAPDLEAFCREQMGVEAGQVVKQQAQAHAFHAD